MCAIRTILFVRYQFALNTLNCVFSLNQYLKSGNDGAINDDASKFRSSQKIKIRKCDDEVHNSLHLQLVELLGGSRSTLDHKVMAMPFTKDTSEVDSIMAPATSATSSPSLPPSTPPPDDVRFDFERLNSNIDDDYDHCHMPAATTSTAITVSTHSSNTTNNDESSTNWRVPASRKSLRTRNPIRAIVDPIMAAAAAAAATNEASSASSDNNGSGAKDQISLAVSYWFISKFASSVTSANPHAHFSTNRLSTHTQLGDPTVYGSIPPCPAITSAIIQSLQSSQSYGYINACGTNQARLAIAKHHSSHYRRRGMQRRMLSKNDDINGCGSAAMGGRANVEISVSPDDVIVANGVSGALELALTALLDEDTVLLSEHYFILCDVAFSPVPFDHPLISLFYVSIQFHSKVPRPGFPLYQVIAESHGASVEHYNLLPDKDWECDLDHMERILVRHDKGTSGENGSLLVVPKTTKVVRGILVNNPSNPTGAVYREEHLLQIIELAEKYRVPIIADEIYGDMTFGRCGKSFCPMANVAAMMGYSVPIVTASGLGKQCEFRYVACLAHYWVPHIICVRSCSRMEIGLDCLPGQSLWCNPGGQERCTSLSSSNIGFESSCPNGYSCCIGPF